MVQAIPSGYAGVTPYLIIKGAAKALEFYKKAFGATEIMRIPVPEGKVGHAEIKMGDASIMLAIGAGAKVVMPVENKFYGDRSGSLEDPFGHHWHFATHVEDVPPDEMAKRAEAF